MLSRPLQKHTYENWSLGSTHMHTIHISIYFTMWVARLSIAAGKMFIKGCKIRVNKTSTYIQCVIYWSLKQGCPMFKLHTHNRQNTCQYECVLYAIAIPNKMKPNFNSVRKIRWKCVGRTALYIPFATVRECGTLYKVDVSCRHIAWIEWYEPL